MLRFATDRRSLLLGAGALAVSGCAQTKGTQAPLLNVSYDPTREFYRAYNEAFLARWRDGGGAPFAVEQSHGGSGKQARAVIDGLPGDVVTLALASDIDEIAARGLIAADWQTRLPNNASPYTSTIVFLVRKGNPKGIHDWPDLLKPGVEVITPNPKTSGGARWNFLALWGYGQKTYGSGAKAKEFVTKVFKNVPVLDSGARGSTTTFAERGQGDVLIAWENEAFLANKEFGAGKFEIVTPSVSILAEPPVAVVDKNVDRKGTRKVADAYLKFLYTPQAQAIIAQNYYRPRNAAIAAKYRGTFKNIPLFTVAKNFGGWQRAQATFFKDGGLFDQVFADAKR